MINQINDSILPEYIPDQTFSVNDNLIDFDMSVSWIRVGVNAHVDLGDETITGRIDDISEDSYNPTFKIGIENRDVLFSDVVSGREV